MDRLLGEYKNYSPITFSIHSARVYGQPKLTKPKELKGVKQILSVDYIPRKCRCPVFIKDDDVWVKHNDYFSQVMRTATDDIGTPMVYRAKKYLRQERKKKFIYDDNWASIVLRNEAWLRIENLHKQIKEGKFQLDIVRDIREQQEKAHGFDECELCCTDMERFWERLVMELVKI